MTRAAHGRRPNDWSNARAARALPVLRNGILGVAIHLFSLGGDALVEIGSLVLTLLIKVARSGGGLVTNLVSLLTQDLVFLRRMRQGGSQGGSRCERECASD